MILVKSVTYFLCAILWIPQLSFCAPSSHSKVISSTENKTDLNDARDKILVLGKEAIESLVDRTLQEKDWIPKFIKLYQDYFDEKKIAASMLGLSWRKMDASQQSQFLELQRQRLANIYYLRFREWKDVEFKVIKSVRVSPKTIVVSSEVIKKQDRKSHLVFWYLTDERKIRDINIDGISMLKTFHDEYESSVGSDINGFLETLKNKLKAR